MSLLHARQTEGEKSSAALVETHVNPQPGMRTQCQRQRGVTRARTQHDIGGEFCEPGSDLLGPVDGLRLGLGFGLWGFGHGLLLRIYNLNIYDQVSVGRARSGLVRVNQS